MTETRDQRIVTHTSIFQPTEIEVSIVAHIGVLEPTDLAGKNLVVLISVPKGLNAGTNIGPEPLLYRTMLECFNKQQLRIEKYNQRQREKKGKGAGREELKPFKLTIIFGAGLGSNAPFKRRLTKAEVADGLCGYKEEKPTIENLSKHLTKSFGKLVFDDEKNFIEQDEGPLDDLKKDPNFILNGYSRVVLLSDEPSALESNVLYLKKINDDEIEAQSLLNGTKKLTTDEVKALNSISELTFPKTGQKPIEIARNKEEALVNTILAASGYDFLKYKMLHWQEACKRLPDFIKNYELAGNKYESNLEFQAEMQSTRDDFLFRGHKLETLLEEFRTNASEIMPELTDFDFLEYANQEAIKVLLQEVSFFQCHKNTIFFYSKKKVDDGFVSTFKEGAKEITSLAITFREVDIDKLEKTQPVSAISKPIKKPSKYSKTMHNEEEKTKDKKSQNKPSHLDAFFDKPKKKGLIKSVHFENPEKDKKKHENHASSPPIAIPPRKHNPRIKEKDLSKSFLASKFVSYDKPLLSSSIPWAGSSGSSSSEEAITPKKFGLFSSSPSEPEINDVLLPALQKNQAITTPMAIPNQKKPITPKRLNKTVVKAFNNLTNSPPSETTFETYDRILRILSEAGLVEEQASPSPPGMSPKEKVQSFEFSEPSLVKKQVSPSSSSSSSKEIETPTTAETPRNRR